MAVGVGAIGPAVQSFDGGDARMDEKCEVGCCWAASEWREQRLLQTSVPSAEGPNRMWSAWKMVGVGSCDVLSSAQAGASRNRAGFPIRFHNTTKEAGPGQVRSVITIWIEGIT